jgi:hypothetical protein
MNITMSPGWCIASCPIRRGATAIFTLTPPIANRTRRETADDRIASNLVTSLVNDDVVVQQIKLATLALRRISCQLDGLPTGEYRTLNAEA